ncbi:MULTISPECIES: phage head-tail joining protein [unclassified Bartonella]|uniref:phage head-tail joining protein n=1 Tax=unclassified Bartonella TaxID=2645622 RepID=UPI0035CF6331
MDTDLNHVNSKTDRLESLKRRREQIEEALYSGAQSVRHGDKQVSNRSVEELRRALEMLNTQIADLEGRKRSRVFYFNISRGY